MPSAKKVGQKRLDDWLVDHLEIGSRKEAQALILAGEVLVNEKPLSLIGSSVKTNDRVRLRRRSLYYSRAALKLKNAIESWNFKIKNRSFLDVGAAHGGFTQILLEKKASKVITVDVSYGQLHPSIRSNIKVFVLERKNFYHIKLTDLPYIPDAFVIDLSFTSLRNALLHLKSVLPSSEGICLFKPQFEAKPAELTRGIVKDKKVLENIKENFIQFLNEANIDHISYLPASILGRKGNQEFLFWIRY